MRRVLPFVVGAVGATCAAVLKPACVGCDRPTHGPICGPCAADGGVHPYALHERGGASVAPLEHLYFVAEYHTRTDGRPTAVALALHQFKYGGDRAIGHAMQELLATRARTLASRSEYSAIVPVPMHSQRLWKRGLNQSAWLARAVATAMAIPLVPDAILRPRAAPPQAGLNRRSRQQATAGTFRGVASFASSACLLLVDDVYTTGATVRDCVRALFDVGASRVDCLVVLRARGDW